MQALSEIIEFERREIARRHVESLEVWLRRVIDHQLSVIGANYHQALEGKNPVVPPKIAQQIEKRVQAEPHRYPRWIDASQRNEAIAILQHQYEKRFQTVFNPLPKVVVMHMLKGVADHRNPLMHGNACGVRALEQCVCYSNDLIDACKAFFMKINKERQYDAPTFTRFTDSNGNIFHVTAPEGQTSIFDARKGTNGTFHVGDVVTFGRSRRELPPGNLRNPVGSLLRQANGPREHLQSRNHKQKCQPTRRNSGNANFE